MIDPSHFAKDMFRICALAMSDAARLQHPCVGTEHFLSAIMGDVDNGAKRALARMGVTGAKVLHQLLILQIPLSHNKPPLQLAPIADKVLVKALEEQLARGDLQMTAEHLLLAMCVETCAAADMLRAIGASPENVRAAVLAQLRLKGAP